MAIKKIKLTYFDGRGLGEFARLILAAAEVDYENVRVTDEQWEKVKAGTPFGALPNLEFEVDGGKKVLLAQSMTIARFLAVEFGLAGKDALEHAQGDMVIDLVLDYFEVVRKVMYATDETKKKEIAKKCIEEDVPNFLRKAERLLKERGGKHYVGGKLSWADIRMFETLTNLTDPDSPIYFKRYPDVLDQSRRVTLLKDFPLLTGLLQTVRKDKGVKRWLEKRPKNSEEPF